MVTPLASDCRCCPVAPAGAAAGCPAAAAPAAAAAGLAAKRASLLGGPNWLYSCTFVLGCAGLLDAAAALACC
jgi:hypothetical protein